MLVEIKDVNGRTSRTMNAAQSIAILGVLEAGAAGFAQYIPPDMQWLHAVHGAALIGLGMRIAWLRTQPAPPIA